MSTRSLPFLSFIVPIFGQNAPLIFDVFLKRSLDLFPFCCCHCSLKKAFLSLLAVLWNSAFNWMYLSLSHFPLLFVLLLFVKPPQITTLPSCFSFSLVWFCSPPPVQYYGPLSIVLQTLCHIDLIPWIYLLPLLWIHTGFDLSHTCWPSVFLSFL